MQNYFDVVQDRQGNAIRDASVFVYDSNGTLAPLFRDDAGTPLSNPLTTNADGEYDFFAANGRYSLEIIAAGFGPQIKTGVILFDPAEESASSGIGFAPAGVSAVPRTVESKLREIVSAKDFGAVGDGVANDTAALQAAINGAVSQNKTLVIPAGTYNVTNLTLPLVSAYETSSPFWTGALRVVGELGAVIKRVAGGNTAYMVASKRWVDNVAFPTSPVWFQNIRFDGSGIAQDVFVNVGYSSVFENCIFENGTRYGLSEPTTTLNNTALLGSRCCSKYSNNTFRNNGDTGFFVGEAVGSAFITDCWLENCSAYDNGKRNMNIGQAAGWKIISNHAWHSAVTPAPGETWSVRIKNLKSSTIVGNVFEGFGSQTYGLRIEPDSTGGTLGDNDFLLGLGLIVAFDAVGTVKLDNCRFPEPGAKLAIATSTAGAIINDEGSVYREADPYNFIVGGFNSLTQVYALQVSAGEPPRLLNGRQRHTVLGAVAAPGITGWGTDVNFQCDDLTAEIIYASLNATGTRILTLDVSPRSGLKRTIARPSFATGTIEVRRSGDVASWFNLAPGTNLTVAYDGFAWRLIDNGVTP